ncbi:A24 family peptidase [Limnohabitans sp.]|uniref:prepilin peptidase n=1 Tax=Limnohabitans sp. TaxID=1907725 RepID=UPI00286F34D4|nr:A24 family peptidase [Limnohabitans sp.]
MTWLLAFGLGLLLGSFANVLIHRLPRKVMADHHAHHTTERYDLCWPASHCPHCETPLKLRHNIPLLSFIWLKGRCGFCQQPISAVYPWIELTTGLMWVTCAWHWGFNVTALCWAVFATTLLALAVIDWQTTLLPDDLTQALVWSGLIACASGWLPLSLDQSVWGSVIGYSVLWCVATTFERITGKQGMGAGDFKLLAGLGAWLGPLALIPLLIFASLSGAVFGLTLKFTHRLNPDGYVPFGPFLAAAGMLIAVIGTAPLFIWLG